MIKQVISTPVASEAPYRPRIGDIVALGPEVRVNTEDGREEMHPNADRPAVVMAVGTLVPGVEAARIHWSEDETCLVRIGELIRLGSIWDLPFPEIPGTETEQKGDTNHGSL